MLSNMRKALDGLSNKELFSQSKSTERINESGTSLNHLNYKLHLKSDIKKMAEDINEVAGKELIDMSNWKQEMHNFLRAAYRSTVLAVDFASGLSYETVFNHRVEYKGYTLVYYATISEDRSEVEYLDLQIQLSKNANRDKLNESAKSYGSNRVEIDKAIEKYLNFAEELTINDEQVIEQLDSETVDDLIALFRTYEYGSASVQVNNRIYVLEFNIGEDDCYINAKDYADVYNETGRDPFVYAEPIGPLKKNKKFQQAWRNFKLGGEPKFINEKAIDKGVRIYHTETQEDYDALMKDFEERGYKWESGDRPSQVNAMKFYENPVGIMLYNGRLRHLSLDYYREENPQVPIIEYKAKLEKTNGEEINESSSINANITKPNLKKLKKVLNDVYGVTEGIDISGTTLELLNERAMKELIDHISENEEDRIIIESDEHLYVIDYAIYEDGIYFRCTDYQTAWEESRVDPFELANPAGILATNKALQRAWQSAGIGEEPDLDF